MAPPLGPELASSLVGRERELELLEGFLAEVVESGGAAFLIGEPGVGKTRLLSEAAQHAAEEGTRVLVAGGVQFEADLPYAALNHLLMPLTNHLRSIPQPLSDALTVALGLGNGDAPSPLLVCNASLAVLRSEAEAGPVLFAIDDLQWLDPASALVLQLMARRLDATHVGILATIRADGESETRYPGIRVIELEGLDNSAADALVSQAHPQLSGMTRRRLVEEAAGNPLALLELADTVEDLTREHGHIPVVLPLSARLASGYSQRIADLPDATKEAMLILALDGASDLRSLHRLGRDLDTLAPAERARLIKLDGQSAVAHFQHPLVRSAVVDAATSDERRKAHLMLADASIEPDRAAWHRAEAATYPSEDVAAGLEEVARRSLARGDVPSAIAALTRAARLSPSPKDEARRLTEAAYLGADIAGERSSAARLLADARRIRPESAPSLHGAAATAYIIIEGDGSVDDAVRMLIAAIESDDHDWEATNSALTAAIGALLVVCSWSGRATHWSKLDEFLGRLVPAVPELMNVERHTYGNTVYDGAPYRSRLELLIGEQSRETDPGRAFRIGTSSVFMDLLAQCRPVDRRLFEDGQRTGAVRASIVAAIHLTLDAFWSGRWDEADQTADTALDLCAGAGYTFTAWYFHLVKGLVAAGQGRVEEAYQRADYMTLLASSRNALAVELTANHIRTLAATAAGDWEAVFRHSSALGGPGEFPPFVPHALWVAFDLVEAGVRIGRVPDARRHAETMQRLSVSAISPRMALLSTAAQALATEGEDSIALFEMALVIPDVNNWPFDLARVELAYGERLRRSLESSRARDHLRVALDTFERLGAVPWVERAREELRAARDPDTRVEKFERDVNLTPQERAIAQLAASGMSNKDIGKRLFLSPRTVSGHLYRVFPKLGISSRAALRDALATLESSDGS